MMSRIQRGRGRLPTTNVGKGKSIGGEAGLISSSRRRNGSRVLTVRLGDVMLSCSSSGPFASRSVAWRPPPDTTLTVIVGECGERDLGFPRHVGVGLAKTVFQHR